MTKLEAEVNRLHISSTSVFFKYYMTKKKTEDERIELDRKLGLNPYSDSKVLDVNKYNYGKAVSTANLHNISLNSLTSTDPFKGIRQLTNTILFCYFSDDFFDDGVFGDEGYESLLDDYVEKPKAKSKAKGKSNSKKELKDENKYYDYERKGADSVFNLDE